MSPDGQPRNNHVSGKPNTLIFVVVWPPGHCNLNLVLMSPGCQPSNYYVSGKPDSFIFFFLYGFPDTVILI